MALEINEIGIHFRVPDSDGPARATPSAGDLREDSAGGCGDPDRARIVDDCVRRVLQLLAARRER